MKFLACATAALMATSTMAFAPASLPKPSATALNWVPPGMDPAIAEMVEQTTPIASLAMGMAMVSLYEMTNGRMEAYTESKKKASKDKIFGWTPTGEV